MVETFAAVAGGGALVAMGGAEGYYVGVDGGGIAAVGVEDLDGESEFLRWEVAGDVVPAGMVDAYDADGVGELEVV